MSILTILLFLIFLLVLGAAAVGGFLFFLGKKSKEGYEAGNQLVPGVASGAPASWAGAHNAEAKLHRRLVTAMRSAQAQRPLLESNFGDQVTMLETEAAAVDRHIIAASTLPETQKAEALGRLEPAVVAIEEAVGGLAMAERAQVESPEGSAASEVQDRIQALMEARAEVEQHDQFGQTPAEG